MKVAAFKRITVAVDGSPASEAGVRCALSLAGDDTTLVLCNVIDHAAAVRDIPVKAPRSPAERHAAALAIAENGVRAAAAAGVRAESVVVEDNAARGILRCAHEHQSDAVVVGSHGRTGIARAVLGSTADELIRLSDLPLVVAHEHDKLRSGPIAVAMDASDAADAALAVGIALARSISCDLQVFHVLGRDDFKRIDALGEDTPTRAEQAKFEAGALLEDAAGRARARGVVVDSSMLEGSAAEELLKAFDSYECWIAVVGARAPSEVDRIHFGSVVFALAERAGIPVVIVRP